MGKAIGKALLRKIKGSIFTVLFVGGLFLWMLSLELTVQVAPWWFFIGLPILLGTVICGMKAAEKYS